MIEIFGLSRGGQKCQILDTLNNSLYFILTIFHDFPRFICQFLLFFAVHLLSASLH